MKELEPVRLGPWRGEYREGAGGWSTGAALGPMEPIR